MYRPLPNHLPALDGLRGLAALVVLVAHCAKAGYLPAYLEQGFGQIGVAVFYVLSGFLMMHYVTGRPLCGETLRRYAVARISRVLPLFYLVLIIATLIFLVTGMGFYEIRNGTDLLQNWLLISGTSVLWSVPVEIQFYILFPILWWSRDHGRFLLLAALILGGCAALALILQDPRPSKHLPVWLHFFVIGALLRWLLDDGLRNRLPWQTAGMSWRVAAWIMFASLLLVPPGVRIGLGLPQFRNNLDPIAIVLVPLVLWSAAARIGPFALFAAPVLRWYGKISYGLYLLHSPILAIVSVLGIGAGIGGTAQFLAVLTITTIAAAAAFYLFERPVQDALRRRFDKPPIAAQP